MGERSRFKLLSFAGILLWMLLFPAACSSEKVQSLPASPKPTVAPDPYAAKRQRMVERDIGGSSWDRTPVRDKVVLEVMLKTPRHEFVPETQRAEAYEDHPLPIGQGQTISQPYIVGYMTEMLKPQKDQVVLEIGTGSGYQAAVLAQLVKKVYTIEIVEPLAKSAAERLKRLGYANVEVRAGDGYQGWPEHAPFDGIIVTAAAEQIPPALIEQLKPGGRMVIPVGSQFEVQELLLIEKKADGTTTQSSHMPVRFVPLTREGK